MKLTSRTVKVYCILLLALALTSFSACAEWNPFGETATEQGGETETQSGGGLEYKLTDGSGYSVVGIGTCTDTEVVIPSEYEGLPVTRIHNYAFYNCNNVQSVTIPSSVTDIGGYAFYGCTGLTDITISDGVTDIGGHAFYGCTGLSSITFPSSVTHIDYDVLEECTGLESITVPFVGSENGGAQGAFLGYFFGAPYYSGNTSLVPASLRTVVISEGATNIEKYAFYGCTGISEIVIPSSVTYVGKNALTDTAWYKEQPDGAVYAGSVVYAYKGTCPSSVTLKEGTVSITAGAFCDCEGLTRITFPSSMTRIDAEVFLGCTNLYEVHVTDLAAWCGIQFETYSSNPLYYAHKLYLNGTQVTHLEIPSGVTGVGRYAFYGCTSLESITVPDSVTRVGSYAFHNTAWYKEQPDGMVYTGKVAYMYKGTYPKTVTLREDTVGIAGYAFSDCVSLTGIYIPSGVTNIGERAFLNCGKLTDVTLPESVTDIGVSAFRNCTGLTGITVPSGVTSIEESAFAECEKLESIDFAGTCAQWNAITKGSEWNYQSPIGVIHCSDGDVTLN